MKITIEIERHFFTTAPFERIFNLLTDVPASATYFPNVEKIYALDNGVFQWELEKVGPAPYTTQPVYACSYTFDREQGVIRWEPVKGVGNVALSGFWEIKPSSQSTEVRLGMLADLQAPVPSLMKFVAEPLIVREFESYIDKYVENLKKTLDESDS